MATLEEAWDELDFEERATVSALTRVRLGLDRPLTVATWSQSKESSS